ncbi:MAG: glycosyltransferase N-terminal domain-containing protein [Desulfurobacteriaceae bacterium]
MGLVVYNLLILALIPFYPLVKLKARKRGSISLFPRFRVDFKGGKGKILLHVASIGEVNSVKPIVERLKDRVALTVFTDYGLERSKKLFPSVPSRILPIDIYPIVKNFLKKNRPSKILIYETEIWLSFLYAAKRLNIPVYIISGKITEKSFKNFRKFKRFLAPVFENIVFLARSKEDFERAKLLGFKKVELVGDLKLEIEKPKELAKLEIKGKRKVIIWGSTHEGEEELAFKVHSELKKDFPNLLTIIAPRHVNRAKDILPRFPFALRSKTQEISEDVEVYIVDTIGELSSLYRFADVAIIGGSFVKGIGGHNPVEAVVWSKPVIVGEYAKDFLEIAKDLNIPILNERDLISFLRELLLNDDYRKKVIDKIANSFDKRKNVLKRILEAVGECDGS